MPVEDMRVDDGGTHVGWAKQFLDCLDVGGNLQGVRRELVPKRAATGGLLDAGTTHCLARGELEQRLVQVTPSVPRASERETTSSPTDLRTSRFFFSGVPTRG